MNAQQRRALINIPFGALGVVRHATSYPHAGTLISRGRDDDEELRRKIDHDESLNPLSMNEVTALWGED